LKTLENDTLDLITKLIPLSSAYTGGTSENPVGRPKLADEDKSKKTI